MHLLFHYIVTPGAKGASVGEFDGIAVALMIIANLFWLWMLHKYPLSQVYPLTSLGFIFGMLSGWLIFHEQVGLMQWLGVMLVIIGCICIAKV